MWAPLRPSFRSGPGTFPEPFFRTEIRPAFRLVRRPVFHYTEPMNENKCPECASPMRKRYVTDLQGEVIGINLFCVFCPHSIIGGH